MGLGRMAGDGFCRLNLSRKGGGDIAQLHLVLVVAETSWNQAICGG